MRPRSIWTRVEEPLDVRVIVPYVKTSHKLQTVVDCLRIQFVQPELVKVGDDESYWSLLRDEWAKGEEFFIVEQDVIVWTGAISMLQACAQSWCTLPTLCHGRMITTTFGCVKFGKQLVERNPGIWDDISRNWFHLDANFTTAMGWPFIGPHAHYPSATHLNEIQWPDAISKRWSITRKMVWQSMEAGNEPVARMMNRKEVV